jgi:NAD(P)-dependent dehydrogenase (short-subunit alcohol dehydrogenase family)
VARVDLTSRVVLITGARRIGAVVAVELARRGADIALSYRTSKDEAEVCAAEVRKLGRRAVTVEADLSDPAACAALVESTVSALQRLDVLINMASVYVNKPFDQLTLADWDASLSVDLRAAFLCAKAAVPELRAAGGGRIINFSDWIARSGRPRYPGYLPYYVAKAGIIGLTEALALELAADRILVNAIAPGPILAPPELDDADIAAVERATPLGHWGGEAEIVKAVLALVDADFITGETIRVDGGRHVR